MRVMAVGYDVSGTGITDQPCAVVTLRMNCRTADGRDQLWGLEIPTGPGFNDRIARAIAKLRSDFGVAPGEDMPHEPETDDPDLDHANGATVN